MRVEKPNNMNHFYFSALTLDHAESKASFVDKEIFADAQALFLILSNVNAPYLIPCPVCN